MAPSPSSPLQDLGTLVLSNEPVGCEDVDAVDVPGGHGIAQTLQSRPHQRGSAVALVDVGGVWEHCDPIGSDPLAQGGDLADEGLVTGRSLAGNPRVERDRKSVV